MQHLGFTRSVRRADHLLQTPDTFIRAPLPGMQRATAIVHAGPAIGAAFTQYTAEFEAAGTLAPASLQRFIYVIDGSVRVDGRTLGTGDFAYLPPGVGVIEATQPARAAVIEKPYQALTDVAPSEGLVGREQDVAISLIGDEPTIEVKSLIPDEAAFDFRMSVLTYQPGAALPQVEIHVMEHGLIMLAGGGIYRLGHHWYPVQAGDFIYMAPFCPQWFGALGKEPARYLLYKDWARHPQ
ncbi:MAG: (S)-ureidoglycine aminohydrolase [Vicinamibacterales bacterium]